MFSVHGEGQSTTTYLTSAMFTLIQDCGAVVASNFYSTDGPDGKKHPLCEQDYFRRLDLLCAKCGQALRGTPYVTACGESPTHICQRSAVNVTTAKKYHVEHFTCSVCPTVFGPENPYYEHEGEVYCKADYSARFAQRCAGCGNAIMEPFVETSRDMRHECWHRECYNQVAAA